MTPSGKVTEFALKTRNAGPTNIARGPDGNLWFTEFAADKIGRISPKGVVTEFALPRRGRGPAAIATDSGGVLWITEVGPAGNRIARIAAP